MLSSQSAQLTQNLLHIYPTIWKLNDSLQAHIRSLESLIITGEQYGDILTLMILSHLPNLHDNRLEWSCKCEGHESDIDFLIKFLSKEIQRRERSHLS